MVRGKDTHNAVASFFDDLHGRITDTGCCVSGCGFCQNIGFRKTACGCCSHGICLYHIGDDIDILFFYNAFKAINGIIYHQVFSRQIQKLFGHCLSAHWPETGTTSTGHDYTICFHTYPLFLPTFKTKSIYNLAPSTLSLNQSYASCTPSSRSTL